MGAFDDLIPAQSGGGIKPKLKTDYAMGANGVAAPIPGTPEFEKIQSAKIAKMQQLRKMAQTANLSNKLIDKVRDNGIGGLLRGELPTAGMLGSIASHIPGTDAYDLNRSLDTVRANVGFDQLASMRAASPTGGALGNVSEGEGRLLQAVSGSTDLGQSPEQLRKNLARIRDEYKALAVANGGSVRQTGPSPGAAAPARAPASGPMQIKGDADYAKLPQGALFVGPDGVTRRKP